MAKKMIGPFIVIAHIKKSLMEFPAIANTQKDAQKAVDNMAASVMKTLGEKALYNTQFDIIPISSIINWISS